MRARLTTFMASLILAPITGMSEESSETSVEEYVAYVSTGIEREAENMRTAVHIDRSIAQIDSPVSLDESFSLEEIDELEPQ